MAGHLPLDAVAEGPHRDDVPRMRGIALQLAAQHRDVRVDRPAHHVFGVAPDLLQQFEPADDTTAALEERDEQRVFLGPELRLR